MLNQAGSCRGERGVGLGVSLGVRFDWLVLVGLAFGQRGLESPLTIGVQGVSRVSTHAGAPTVNIDMAHPTSPFSYSTFLLE